MPPPFPEFICPSYLRSSRYVQRLAEEHNAAVASTKESRRQARHVFYNKDNPPSAPLSTSSSGVNLSKLSTTYGRPSAQDQIDRISIIDLEEGLDRLPSAWSNTDKCSGLDVLNGGVEVKFTGATKTSDEAASIRSDHSMPKDVGLYYFEVTVLSRGKEG